MEVTQRSVVRGDDVGGKDHPVTAEARTWESGRAISHAPLTQVGQILDRFVEDFSESLTAANSGDQ